ncbi:hypothetical protein [Cryobacterium arcticum]|uniref:hypothetical protein n=1 Tax=Cryobacterium arcticum TaxID=670052 RepID=UPI0015E873C7|nr:hypothetical protein [Cryobacterium arcticum]
MRRHRAHRRRGAAVPRTGDNRRDTDTDTDAGPDSDSDSDSPIVSLGEAAGVCRAVRAPGPVTRALTVVVTGAGRAHPGPDGLPTTGGHAGVNPRSHRAGLDAHAHAHAHAHAQPNTHAALHRHAIRPADVDSHADSAADRHPEPDPNANPNPNPNPNPNRDGTIHAGADADSPTDRHPYAAASPTDPDRCDRGTDIRHPALALCPHAGLGAAGSADSR